VDRHRALHLYIERHDADLLNKSGQALHYAPEPSIYNILRLNAKLRYAASDLESPKLLAQRGRTFRSDIYAIPLRDASVDVVFCLHLIEHLEDDTKAIAELFRVMGPDAIAYIMVPIDLRNEVSVFFGRPHPDYFYHYWSHARDFKEKLSAFDVEEILPSSFLTPEESHRFSIPEKEIIYRCVKRRTPQSPSSESHPAP
jgi:SAM-dependent methyltransferase